MARSMTGFGESELVRERVRCRCRVKSVNNRYLQIAVRIEPADEELEIGVRRFVQDRVSRGSLDVSMKLVRESSGAERAVFHESLFDAMKPALAVTGALVTLDGLVRAGIVEVLDEGPEATGEDREALMSCVRQAVEEWDQSRETEGAALARHMTAVLGDLRAAVERICELDSGRVESVTTRLKARMTQLLDGQAITEQRLLEEAAYLAQRWDISEEIERLKSHFTAFKELLEGRSVDASGKRMEFILQEILREVNTLGSKAQDPRITGLAVDSKVFIEKLRQQAANIE